MRTVDIIGRKRDGAELSREEIEHLVLGYVRGDIHDHQMSAWLMAVCCRGMTRRETLHLTRTMLASGSTLDLSRSPWPTADKHSSGGVGDKTTLVVAPLVRACGVAVAKMSGRGLGFTGGTIDKLESIPGYRVDLGPAQFLAQLEREGIVLSGQTGDLVPADRKLCALRDVTGTVASLPLIASSIMSKKLAVGAGALVLDVKVGAGAFMATRDEARQLGELMVEIGAAEGRHMSALLSAMDEPLGRAVGNAIEVAEAIRTLRGEGPADLVELSTRLAGELLLLAGRADSPEAGDALAREAIASGAGLRWLARLIEAQGGDPRVVDAPELLGRAPEIRQVRAPRRGWLARLDARGVADAALALGAGRSHVDDTVDPLVGVVLHAKVGDEVGVGETLAEVHARNEVSAEDAAARILAAVAIGEEAPRIAPRLLGRIAGS